MPLLTKENLPELTTKIDAYFAAYPERWRREEVWALFYGTEDSYAVKGDYLSLYGKNLFPLSTNCFTNETQDAAQQLTELIEKAETERVAGRNFDVIIWIPEGDAITAKRGCWAGEDQDVDAIAAKARRQSTPAKWDAEAIAADESLEIAHRNSAVDYQLPSDLTECLECGAKLRGRWTR